MSKVVSFRGEPTTLEGKPHENLIKHLREILERAESGEIQGMGAAFVYRDGSTSWDVVGIVGGYSMVGASQCVLHDLTKTAAREASV